MASLALMYSLSNKWDSPSTKSYRSLLYYSSNTLHLEDAANGFHRATNPISRFVHHKILVKYGLMKSPIMFHLCGLAILSPFFSNFEYKVNASISQNVLWCSDSSLVLQSGYTIHALTILVNDNGWNLRLECSGSCPSKFLFSFFTGFLISADWSTTQSVSESRRFETAD